MTTPAPLPKKGLAAPGYTQIPNEILETMPLMKEAELRITLAIARKTFGWRKRKDKLSHSQLKELTGLSKQGVQNGIDAALERGFVDREPASRQQFFYFLVVNDVDQSESEAVNVVDRSSQRSRPEPVNVVETQKKRKESIKENGGGIDPAPPATPPSAPAIAAAVLKDLETAQRQKAREVQDNETSILSAFRRFNESIKQSSGGFIPITGTGKIARDLALRGETETTMKAAWDTCKANAIKPMGAFMKWIQEGYLPPQQEGHETKVVDGVVNVWVEGQGWMEIGGKAQ